MGYQEHNFVTGHKLTGADMAEIDAQIALNERNITALTEEMEGVRGAFLDMLRRLSLRADTSTVLLDYGVAGVKETLCAVSLPDSGSAVACTGLAVTADLTGLAAGDTVQIATAVAPSGSTEIPWYSSSDPDVVTVTTDGLVTVTGYGSATIVVHCGSVTETINVSVAKPLSLAGNTDYVNWISMAGWSSTPGAIYDCSDGANAYLGLIPYDIDTYKIRNGEKVTITTTGGWRIRKSYIVATSSGADAPAPQDLRASSDRYLIGNTVQVEEITSGLTSYTYNNRTGDDCYMVLMIEYRNCTLEEAMANIDDYVSVVVDAADAAV